MSASKSIHELEMQTTLQREKLASRVVELRTHIQPSYLAREATETLSTKASDALHVAAEKAKTPKGIGGAALAALALGATTFFSVRMRAKRAPSLRSVAMINTVPATSTIIDKPVVNKELLGAAASLVGALALGAALSKVIPASEKEQQLLAGVGDELKDKALQWTRQYVADLARPAANGSFSPINAIASGLGLLMPEKPRL